MTVAKKIMQFCSRHPVFSFFAFSGYLGFVGFGLTNFQNISGSYSISLWASIGIILVLITSVAISTMSMIFDIVLDKTFVMLDRVVTRIQSSQFMSVAVKATKRIISRPGKSVALFLVYWNLAHQFFYNLSEYDGFRFEELFGVRFVISLLAIPAAHLMFMVMNRINTKKPESSSQELPQEVRRVFDRMVTGKESPTQEEVQKAKQNILKTKKQKPSLKMEDVIKELIEEDAEMIARGEIPETRLIPHHAIKRDIIIYVYNEAFIDLKNKVNAMNASDQEKRKVMSVYQETFDKQIYGIMRLSLKEIDKSILSMKENYKNFNEIEQIIRKRNPVYKIVDPL